MIKQPHMQSSNGPLDSGSARHSFSRRSLFKAGAIAGAGALMGMALPACASGSSSSDNTDSSDQSQSQPEATNDTNTDTSGKKVYSAVAPSMKGDITVFVTMDGDKLDAVDVLDDVDTPAMRDAAISVIPAKMVEDQNLDVDTVSGATITSMAIISGAESALTDGGVDTSSLKKGLAKTDKTEKGAEDFDLVIVGSGMSGMSAALTARRQGVEKVLMIEKQAYTGGSSRVCGGGIWAVNSLYNDIIGQTCPEDEYVSFMTKWSEPTELNTNLLHKIWNSSADPFTYLMGWGLPVNCSGWSLGNPDVALPVFWSTAGQATVWETGNSGIADFLTTLATNEGVEIRLNTKMTSLISESGSVSGVYVEDLENTYTVNAKKVILACGGFTRNPELIEKYAPDYTSAFPFTGGGSNGDGIIMTEELGTQVVGSGMMGLFGLNENLGYYGPMGNLVWQTPITVNAEGETFGMEGAFYGLTLKLLIDQTDHHGFGIADSTNEYVDRFEEAVEKGYVNRYDTLDDLASGEGIAADALKKTCEDAEVTCEDAEVTKAPFYCIIKRPLFIGSIPGLKVNENCELLDSDDQPIGNLYGVGELIFGNAFSNAYPCSGTGVGTSCYTGFIGATNAVKSM